MFVVTPLLSRRVVLGGAVAASFAGRAQAADRVLKVAYIPILAMSQLFVIVGEGWAKEAGLDLQLTRFSSGPAMVQALASGGYDVAYVGIGPAMVARGSGLDLRVVAANGVNQRELDRGRGVRGRVRGGGEPGGGVCGKFHRQTSGRAVRIATLPKGSVPDTVLRYWLDEVAHVAPGDVQVLGVGEDRVQQALLAGSADAASALEPILTVVQERVPSARILVGRGGDVPGPARCGAGDAGGVHPVEQRAAAAALLVAACAGDEDDRVGPGAVRRPNTLKVLGEPG